MKTIFFIRHAKSSWEDPELGDIDRPLNPRGLRDAPFMAKLLRAKGTKPDKLIASPANRAYTTARYFAAELGHKEKHIEVRKEIYHAFMEDILEIIRTLDVSYNSVCFFGHNPTFTSLANHFSETYIANVPTCGIIQLESTAKEWYKLTEQNTTLKNFYYPKQYF